RGARCVVLDQRALRGGAGGGSCPDHRECDCGPSCARGAGEAVMARPSRPRPEAARLSHRMQEERMWLGAGGRTRTGTAFRLRDFKSLASTISPRPRLSALARRAKADPVGLACGAQGAERNAGARSQIPLRSIRATDDGERLAVWLPPPRPPPQAGEGAHAPCSPYLLSRADHSAPSTSPHTLSQSWPCW